MPAQRVPHVLVVNLGTPVAPTAPAVREFLEEFLSDPAVVDLPRWFWQPVLNRAVLRSRPARVAAQYASIWTDAGSPPRVETEQIVAALERIAADRFTVSAAYRYGAPSIESELRRVARFAQSVRLVPLFPQRTDATVGTIQRRAREIIARDRLTTDVIDALVPPTNPGYVSAMAARWREALGDAPEPPDHLVISFHGIPVRYNRREKGVYTDDCAATTAAFLDAIGWPVGQATLAYQSKFGPEPWLKPATAQLLADLPRRGITRVAVITPGFLTEGLETIEEIGIRGRETFQEAGGRAFIRVPAVADHPAFIEGVANLASEPVAAPR